MVKPMLCPCDACADKAAADRAARIADVAAIVTAWFDPDGLDSLDDSFHEFDAVLVREWAEAYVARESEGRTVD